MASAGWWVHKDLLALSVPQERLGLRETLGTLVLKVLRVLRGRKAFRVSRVSRAKLAPRVSKVRLGPKVQLGLMEQMAPCGTRARVPPLERLG